MFTCNVLLIHFFTNLFFPRINNVFLKDLLSFLCISCFFPPTYTRYLEYIRWPLYHFPPLSAFLPGNLTSRVPSVVFLSGMVALWASAISRDLPWCLSWVWCNISCLSLALCSYFTEVCLTMKECMESKLLSPCLCENIFM